MRTRSAAAALAESGHVRVNGQRIAASARPVKIGDVLTVATASAVRVLRIEALAERRGAAPAAQGLYADLTPPREPRAQPEPSPVPRTPGAGRPTKRDRRALERDPVLGKRNAFS